MQILVYYKSGLPLKDCSKIQVYPIILTRPVGGLGYYSNSEATMNAIKWPPLNSSYLPITATFLTFISAVFAVYSKTSWPEHRWPVYHG